MKEKQFLEGKSRRGMMFVLSSPSGAGKTSLCRAILEKYSNIELSVSVTTRKARPKEREGEDYHFVTEESFLEDREKNLFLETARVFDHYYGTLELPVKKALERGQDVLFDIDWQGAQQLSQRAADDLVKVFVLPPSLMVLEERLKLRAEDNMEVIKNRMKRAVGEMSHWAEYDYVLINDSFEKSLEKLGNILAAERQRRHRQLWIQDFIRNMTDKE